MKFLHLSFIPHSPSFALLIARIWFGASMLWLHGLGKLEKLNADSVQFLDPLSIGAKPSLYLAIFAEVICAGLLIGGLFTRFAALCLAITMAVAFFGPHEGKLIGDGNGELAFMYLAGFVVIFFAGAGSFSIDSRIGGK